MTLRIIAMAACALPVLAQIEVEGHGSPTATIIPLKQISFSSDLPGYLGQAAIAFDQDHVYISSPDGIILAADSLASDLHPIFQTASGINRIYEYDHALYVLTGGSQSISADHALWESKDHGNSFVAIDDGLQECLDSSCGYLVADQLIAQDGLLFSNAGGGPNLLVSQDQGVTWIPLSGGLFSQICYTSPFAIVGRTVLQGGECPLDIAFLSRGVLGANMLFFESNLTSAHTPYLSNRRINAIAHQPGTSVVLAGAEGALLRSVDDGRSWEFVIEESGSSGAYPYISNLLFSSRRPGIALAGGFDKAKQQPFLAFSSRRGTQWSDISSLLGNIEHGTLSDLKEDPYGRLIAVVIDAVAKTLTVDEVIIRR